MKANAPRRILVVGVGAIGGIVAVRSARFVAQAHRLGLDVPACRTVVRLVKGPEYAARERRHRTPQETAA